MAAQPLGLKMFNSKPTSIKYLSRKASQSTIIGVRSVDKASDRTFGDALQQIAVSIAFYVNVSWSSNFKFRVDAIPVGFYGERVYARIKSCRLGTGASQYHFSHHVTIPNVACLREFFTLSSDDEGGSC
jgi:hypothetical protein